MTILHIETSTTVCSVAISNGTQCIFEKADFQGMNHAALLSTYIEEGIHFLKSVDLKLEAIAVSAGPGSYTGLRIGVSTAKGLCFGYGIPLIAIDTLKTMWQEVILNHNPDPNALFCPMIDARRMEVYDKLVNFDGSVQRETAANIIDGTSYATELNKSKLYFFGNGSTKCKDVITSENAIFIDKIAPLAKNMIFLAKDAFEKKQFVDVAYFEPFYLKEFQATTPKNKI